MKALFAFILGVILLSMGALDTPEDPYNEE